jgi:outer membrane protein assembly factor BamB
MGKFGLLFSRPVDGTIQAQPLYLPNVQINGATHNVVYVATENNTVYAFDADDPAASTPLWHTSLGAAYPASLPSYGCTDLIPEVGVSATPVIDPASGTIYIVTQQDGTTQKLHALDVTTGAEKTGSPVQIMAPANWDPSNLFSRVGLLLTNGVLYGAFASHCDINEYKGWVFAFDPTSLAIKATYTTGLSGGIWQSGMGLSTDDTGAVFFVAGIGNHIYNYGLPLPDAGVDGGAPDPGRRCRFWPGTCPVCGPSNLCNSVGRLTLSGGAFTLANSFTPSNANSSQAFDLDLATAAVIGGKYAFVSGKDAVVHVLDSATLNLVQDLGVYWDGGVPNSGSFGHVHSPNYWVGPNGPVLYVWPEQSPLMMYSVMSTGMPLGMMPDKANPTFEPAHPGAITTISSNGTTAHTGILWAASMTTPTADAWHTIVPGTLRAYDAEDVTKLLWTSDMNMGDALGNFAKFCAPTVTNGKVYIGTATTATLDSDGGSTGPQMATLQVYGAK